MLFITIPMVRAAYTLLSVTPPFRHWKLPPADQVIFFITRSTTVSGDYHRRRNGKHVIRVSGLRHGSLEALLKTVAHEMIHLHEEGYDSARCDVQHSWLFRRWAKIVCNWHRWDLNEFV